MSYEMLKKGWVKYLPADQMTTANIDSNDLAFIRSWPQPDSSWTYITNVDEFIAAHSNVIIPRTHGAAAPLGDPTGVSWTLNRASTFDK